jgi:diguanylate cyclase (GGDEF)-like protein
MTDVLQTSDSPKRPSGVLELRDTGAMKVLVADDSSISRRILADKLKKWGFEVILASDGTEALAVLQGKTLPSIAILDWEMPGFTGPELCRKVREQAREPYVYLILLTANERKEALVEGLAAGADDYVRKPFDEQELEVRLRAGERIGDLQQQLIAAREMLRAQATHDPLTTLFNRGAIVDILRQELVRGKREGTPVAALLVDLDHFKVINDTYGHLVGDVVLCEAAKRIREGLRTYDAVGRFGGEEFLVVMPGCDRESASKRAEEIRAALGKGPVKNGGALIRLTGSIGVAVSAESIETKEILEKADAALYKAKDFGRNRVECA